jgi:hypothetical protein
LQAERVGAEQAYNNHPSARKHFQSHVEFNMIYKQAKKPADDGGTA